jgi:putative endonuclease
VRLGERGERAAAAFLKRKRIRVLVRNYRCPLGEIDLICRDGETVVFVEVKTRADDQNQELSESVHPRQWNRIARAARFYLQRCSIGEPTWRIDLITVEWPAGAAPQIQHFEDAFAPLC